MRKVLLIILMGIFCYTLFAEILTINFQNGESIEINIDEIDEISFGADVSTEEMVEFINQVPIKLLGNYPNPFNSSAVGRCPTTTISFELANSGKVRLEVYNSKGEKVKLLIDEIRASGKHSIVWNGENSIGKRVASGVYFYKISLDSAELHKKMLMIK